MLIEYQPIVLTDILLRGPQISQDPLLQLVAYENFRNSSIIHKEKNKRNQCLRSVFISDIDMAKLYIQYFRPK